MGCRILEDRENNGCCFYCSTTGVAFGPVMQSREEAEKFIEELEPADPRNYTGTELMSRHADFVQAHVCECGTVRDEMDAEIKAQDATHSECTCDDHGTCEYCRAKEAAQMVDPGERFRCWHCARKAAKKAKAAKS